MNALGWFLFGVAIGVICAWHEPEPGVEVGDVQKSWTDSDGLRWAFA